MKKTLFYLMALTTAIAMVCACTKESTTPEDEKTPTEQPEEKPEEKPEEQEPVADAITVSDAFASPYSAPAEGATVENVAIEANKAWTAVSSADFVTLDPASGEAGNTTVTVTVAANDTYEPRTAEVTFTCGTAEVKVTVEQAAKEKPQAVDLSENATANCYAVSAAGLYKIKAVKGNSNESVGDVATAVLLWTDNIFSDFEGVVTSASVSYADGYVQFATTGTNGNAILAAKDAAGNILWSWHIWVLPEHPEVQLGGYTALKHQLGYIPWENDAFGWGLLYQWGRKDPFAINWAKVPAPSDIFNTAVSVGDEGVLGSDGTAMAYSIAHPNHFIKGNDTTCDWYAAEGANQNNGLWAETKTVNDPCPVGYVVAPAAMYANIQNVTPDVTDIRHAMVCDGVDFFYSGTIEYAASFAQWGYSGSWTWSRETVTGSPFAQSCYILNGIIEPNKGWYRGTAMAVRCVKE